MTFKENFDLIFRKSKVLKIFIYMPDRRIKTFVRELDGIENGEHLNIMEGVYIVLHDYIYFSNGVACLYFKYDNPAPMDMSHNRFVSDKTASKIYTVLNNKVFNNLVAEAKGKDPNMIFIMIGIGLILVMLGGFYYLNEQITVLQELNTSYKEIIESLRDSIMNGDVN